MTSDTIRKRAERLRRKEAGEQRVEVWLEPHHLKRLDYLCAKDGVDRAEGLRRMVGRYGSPIGSNWSQQ